jgi:hypothetical protein
MPTKYLLTGFDLTTQSGDDTTRPIRQGDFFVLSKDCKHILSKLL